MRKLCQHKKQYVAPTIRFVECRFRHLMAGSSISLGKTAHRITESDEEEESNIIDWENSGNIFSYSFE